MSKNKKSEFIHVRADSEDIKRWKLSAEAQDTDFSKFVRQAMDYFAGAVEQNRPAK